MASRRRRPPDRREEAGRFAETNSTWTVFPSPAFEEPNRGPFPGDRKDFPPELLERTMLMNPGPRSKGTRSALAGLLAEPATIPPPPPGVFSGDARELHRRIGGKSRAIPAGDFQGTEIPRPLPIPRSFSAPRRDQGFDDPTCVQQRLDGKMIVKLQFSPPGGGVQPHPATRQPGRPSPRLGRAAG